MHERYHKQRWIVRLDEHVNVVRHVLECATTACTRPAVVYRPQQEDALAWRGYTFGLDVVARMGEWRYRDHWSIRKMREPLQAESPLSIALTEVALWCEVLLALVTTVVQHDNELIAQWHTSGGIILAIDGVQPENSHETRYMLRDVCSGRVWVAKTLLSSATAEIAPWLEEGVGLGLTIVGVMSDTQASMCWAVQQKFPTGPHQMCQYHDLQDVAPPVCEADRHVKQAINKKVRGVSDVERQAEPSLTKEAQVVAD
jgi:hypothetical protein